MPIQKDNGKSRLVFRPDPKDVPEIMRRTRLILGQPFVFLPDRQMHKVLAILSGHKVRTEDVEMVFNDALTMDFTYRGIGPTTASMDDVFMSEVRKLATELYGQTGLDAQVKYGTVCLECGLNLPEHLDTCKAGIRYRDQLRKMNAGPPTVA